MERLTLLAPRTNITTTCKIRQPHVLSEAASASYNETIEGKSFLHF